MSLEAAIAKLTAAVEQNSELLVKAAEGRERVLAAAESVSSTATRTTAARPKTETKAEPETKPEPKVETANMSEVQTTIASYIGEDGISDEEKKARNAKVIAVLSHPKVNAKKVSDIPPALEGAVVKAVNKLIAEGNVLADEDTDLLDS